MCGPAVLTRLLSSRRNGEYSVQHIPDLSEFGHHGMLSLEQGADTDSQSSLPKIVGRNGYFSATESSSENSTSDFKRLHRPHPQRPQREQQQQTGDQHQLGSHGTAGTCSSESSATPPFRVCVADGSDGEVIVSEEISSDEEEGLVNESSLLSNMRNVLEQQQAALLEIAQQNQQFKSTLFTYRQEMKMLRDETTSQKIRLAQLTLQKEAIENESVYWKTKVDTLQTQLEEKAELRERFESLMMMGDNDDESTVDETDCGGSFENEVMNITPPPAYEEEEEEPCLTVQPDTHMDPQLVPYPFARSPTAQHFATAVETDAVEVSIRRKNRESTSPVRIMDFKHRLEEVREHRRERVGRQEI